MSDEEVIDFIQRIDKLKVDQKGLFGKMNANQMICHCADQLRLAMGTKKATEYGKVDAKQMLSQTKSGKHVPTPKGFGQIEGDGTKPINFENDIKTLKEQIVIFSKLDTDFQFSVHPYFGKLDKNMWGKLVKYHLNHHLQQFCV